MSYSERAIAAAAASFKFIDHIFEKKRREKNSTTQIDDAIHYSFRIVSSENKSMIIISFVNILSSDLMKDNSPRHRFQNYNFTFIFFMHK